MWITLSAGRWIFLLSLAAGTIFPTLGATSFDLIAETCCFNVSTIKVPKVSKCYEQMPRKGCNQHAYLVTNKRGRKLCISDQAQWLVNMIEKGKVKCPQV